jgi:hypothetical protein
MKYKINIMYNVGKAKYLVSYSDGSKTHKDGSEFFDVAIFKSKKAMYQFITSLNLK